jgi:hypothetical protein
MGGRSQEHLLRQVLHLALSDKSCQIPEDPWMVRSVDGPKILCALIHKKTVYMIFLPAKRNLPQSSTLAVKI